MSNLLSPPPSHQRTATMLDIRRRSTVEHWWQPQLPDIRRWSTNRHWRQLKLPDIYRRTTGGHSSRTAVVPVGTIAGYLPSVHRRTFANNRRRYSARLTNIRRQTTGRQPPRYFGSD